MEITINAEPGEIAALVESLQERPDLEARVARLEMLNADPAQVVRDRPIRVVVEQDLGGGGGGFTSTHFG